MPKTSSYGERFMFVLNEELNANGKVLTFCDHVSYSETKTVLKNLFCCLLLFSSNLFDHGEYAVRGLYCTLYMRQKRVN